MSKGHAELTDIDAELKHITYDLEGDPKAYLLYDGKTEAWVPASKVENNKDGTFTMPVWLATDRGFV